MKFFLTLYVCSVVGGSCIEVPQEKHAYDRFYKTHYSCVQKGLGNSYEILFNGDVFAADQVEALELYPKFVCEKVVVPKKKPAQTTES
jgi:hypothetical protein